MIPHTVHIGTSVQHFVAVERAGAPFQIFKTFSCIGTVRGSSSVPFGSLRPGVVRRARSCLAEAISSDDTWD